MLQLCDLYENDCIFDKFDCAMSGRGDYVCTGSYSNFFKVTARTGGDGCLVEAARDPLRKRLQTPKVGPLVEAAVQLTQMVACWHTRLPAVCQS